MVQAGQKRAASRRSQGGTPSAKKLKTSTSTSTPARSTPTDLSPAPSTPAPEVQAPRLPPKISESRSLPVLAEQQAVTLSNEDYQSLAASAVLQASLDRSRLRWTNNGIFQRYWVKPETGKHARPPPPGNPETNWMKGKGQCRIRIEPHIFEAELYVEEKFKPAPAPKQYVPPKNAFNQPYRPPQPAGQPYMRQPNQQFQNRPLNAPGQVGPNGQVLQPNTNQQSGPQPPNKPPLAPAQQDAKKVQPDPVISLLAARASSDQSLKTLMKEVATGNATQDQLRIFQRHIDELTKIIQEDKRKKEEEEKKRVASAAAVPARVNTPSTPGTPVPLQPQSQPQMPPQQQMQPQQPPRPYMAPQQPVMPYVPPQPKYTPPQPPPPPPCLPVILGFVTPGATDDRFLFPQHSILEALSPQHLLVSFIVTREGKEAADTTGLDPTVTYWSPVTMMVEVAYGREELLNHIRRWVKPAEEVKKHMEETMQKCKRVPDAHLALRLPFKGSALAEDETLSRHETPVGTEEKPKDKAKRKSNIMYVKSTVPATPKEASQPAADAVKGPLGTATDSTKPAAVKEAEPPSAPGKEAPAAAGAETTVPTNKDESVEKPAVAEAETGRRSQRSTRKSVRISTG